MWLIEVEKVISSAASPDVGVREVIICNLGSVIVNAEVLVMVALSLVLVCCGLVALSAGANS